MSTLPLGVSVVLRRSPEGTIIECACGFGEEDGAFHEQPVSALPQKWRAIIEAELDAVLDDGHCFSSATQPALVIAPLGHERALIATALSFETTEQGFRRAATEQSGEGITLADPRGRYVFVNPSFCDMMGFSREELLAMTLFDVLQPAEPTPLFSKVRDERRPGVRSAMLRRKDGSLFDAEIAGFPADVSGRPYIIGFARDITHRRAQEEDRLALEAKIQNAQKLESLAVLAGGIAHDFNNLLVGILGNAELCLTELVPEAPSRQYVSDIEREAIRAAKLVQQMLAYSGKGRFNIERLDLTSVVTEMTHLLEVSVARNSIIKYDLTENLPKVMADAAQVRQVLINLVTNASEAIAGRSGIITIRTGAMECDQNYIKETYLDDDLSAGVYCYIEVSDTGCGIAPDIVTKIFDPFFTTKFTGRGLGLAATLGIIRGHRGALKVYSEVRKGSTIKALFPAVIGDSDAQVRAKAAATSSPCSGTVLVVDDDETVRTIARRLLERLGFQVLIANDGHEAIKAFEDAGGEVTCVLLDLTMPNMDGEACYRELKRIKKDIKVILMSGYNRQEMITRFVGKGLVGVLQKPFRMKQLAELLTKVSGADNK